MRNIEMKARLADPNAAERTCRTLGATPGGVVKQRDTYYNVAHGRLKFREENPGRTEIIFYRRPDVLGPKASDYMVEPADPAVKSLLAEALGILAVVEKARTLYLWENVRIHLDHVKGLGSFIEFEAVLSPPYDDADGRRKLDQLIEAFGLQAGQHLRQSYLDLVLARSAGSAPSGAGANCVE